jgi:hypothetical protein
MFAFDNLQQSSLVMAAIVAFRALHVGQPPEQMGRAGSGAISQLSQASKHSRVLVR